MQKIIVPSFESYIKNSDNTIFYDMVGNFVPPEWRELISYNGKVLSKTAKQILSLVVSRIFYEEDKTEKINSNNIIPPNELQETYYFFEKMLGLCQRRIRQCFVELEKSGYIKVALINTTKQYIKYRNILSISLAKNFVPYPQKISAQPEKVFGCTRNNFHPHNIIDNNKSILKSRYEESNFENNFFEDEKLAIGNEIAEANVSQDLQQDFSITNNDVINEELNNTENELISKVVNTAKSLFFARKMAEFHPLTKEDAEKLRLTSNREFNLKFINKLLLKLAESKPNNRFATKERLLNYMAKALACEMRNPELVNNENFNFEHNYKEKYLKDIEYSSDVSMKAQLRRKISAVFEADIAYSLLKSCVFADEVSGNEYKLVFERNINLSENTKRILLNQIQAVYGKKIEQLKVIGASSNNLAVKLKKERQELSNSNEVSVESYIETVLVGLDPIWGKVREFLISYCGKAADTAWFSKLELVKKDETNNKIFLKPETAFVGSRITANYFIQLKKAFENFNYSYELIKV